MQRITIMATIAMAFMAGTITTSVFVTATSDEEGKTIKTLQDQVNRLLEVVQIDPNTGDVTIKSNGNLNLDSDDGKMVKVKDNTEMTEDATIMGETMAEGEATFMQNTIVQQSLEAHALVTPEVAFVSIPGDGHLILPDGNVFPLIGSTGIQKIDTKAPGAIVVLGFTQTSGSGASDLVMDCNPSPSPPVVICGGSTNNLFLNGDFDYTGNDILVLISTPFGWLEVSRSMN